MLYALEALDFGIEIHKTNSVLRSDIEVLFVMQAKIIGVFKKNTRKRNERNPD